MNIYVEILIRTEMGKLWEYTQKPERHEIWDLRFSTIQYLPRPDLGEPQQFLYITQIGFGLAIKGKGETVGSKTDATGSRTSALKFWSEEPVSLIGRGSGYWKYEPQGNAIRFLTEYTYQTRFGWIGAQFDRWVFRPMMGWATAWSFDRLRLWLEEDIDPVVSLERSVVYSICRLTLAIIWVYQGVVPKLLFRDTGELNILQQSGMFAGKETMILSLVGIGEIVFGLLLIKLWHSRLLTWLNILCLSVLGAGAFFSQPQIFVAPFNPLTLNLAMTSLAVICLVAGRHLPSAGHCRRKRPERIP